MAAGATSSSGTDHEGVDELRARCERYLDLMRELSRIHLEIDAPTRRLGADEPDWICRLRKIYLHVWAIDGWEIGADVEHVMATDLRAAYVQMGAVWKRVPGKFRPDEMGDGPWANEARHGMLATYDHPTPQSLRLSAGRGGFGSGEDGRGYAQARRMAMRSRARVRTRAHLSGRGAGCRSERRVPRDDGVTQVQPGDRRGLVSVVSLRNPQVSGSSPLAGSSLSTCFTDIYGHSPRAAFVTSARVGCT